MRRTRRALQEALGDLVAERSPVTMSAVAQRAGLSRQVLHSHYDSIDQLASEVLVRRVLERTGHVAEPDREAAVRALVDAVRTDGLAPFLRFIRSDRDVFTALRSMAHRRSAAVLAQVFTGLIGDLGRTPADPEAALFATGGMTALVDSWLGDESAPTPDEQATRLERYARAAFAAAGATAAMPTAAASPEVAAPR